MHHTCFKQFLCPQVKLLIKEKEFGTAVLNSFVRGYS